MAVPWTYSGAKGPKFWKTLCPEYGSAEASFPQSPIDIHERSAHKINASEFEIHYHKTNFITGFSHHVVHMKPVDTEEVNYILFRGERYNLVDLHNHMPSEHTINSKYYQMEWHFVHKKPEDQNQILVMGIVFEVAAGRSAVQSSFLNAGSTVSVDLEGMLPTERKFYHYVGSLTTPPTKGPINWIVMCNPSTLKANVYAEFLSKIKTSNRPVQDLAGRTIYISN